MENGRMSKREKYKFYCNECKEFHSMHIFCIDNLTMGNSIEFECFCKSIVIIHPEDIEL